MRVITFSRVFPSNHPRKGEPTRFVEKIWESIYMDNVGSAEKFDALDPFVFDIYLQGKYSPKNHTIRAGNRWKVSDKFSPRIWSGAPYKSKQIQFAPPIEIKKIWDIQISGQVIFINQKMFSEFKHSNQVANLAKNDGLEVRDFWNWFKIKPGKVFEGQIIAWSDHINY